MNALSACEPDFVPEANPFAALRFAPRPPDADRGRKERSFATVLVVALHALFFWFIESQSRNEPLAMREDEAIRVDFIARLPEQRIRADAPAPPERATQAPPRTARPAKPQTPTQLQWVAPAPPPAQPATDAPLRLYAPDGSLRLPDGLMAKIDANAQDKQFEFQLPDLDKAGRFLDRPPVLAYEATRFEQYWQPNENMLDAILRKAVEKTTKEVRIPMPGAPGKSIVCRVSLLAAGGTCGVEFNGARGHPGEDDPATLSPQEAAACQAWWDRIVGAATQAEWRGTRKLYEAECRKPLLDVPPQAKPAPAMN
jgi:hypothetical protein